MPGRQPPPETDCSSSSASLAQQNMNEAARGTKEAFKTFNISSGNTAASPGLHNTFILPELAPLPASCIIIII